MSHLAQIISLFGVGNGWVFQKQQYSECHLLKWNNFENNGAKIWIFELKVYTFSQGL